MDVAASVTFFRRLGAAHWICLWAPLVLISKWKLFSPFRSMTAAKSELWLPAGDADGHPRRAKARNRAGELQTQLAIHRRAAGLLRKWCPQSAA
jgi:hypothetical protein